MMESKIKDLGMKDVLNVLQNEAKTNLGVKDVLVQSLELYKGIHYKQIASELAPKQSILTHERDTVMWQPCKWFRV